MIVAVPVSGTQEESARGDLRVFQQHQRDHAVVVRSFGIIKNGRDLCEVTAAKLEIDCFDRFRRQQAQCLGIDFQNFLPLKIGVSTKPSWMHSYSVSSAPNGNGS